MDLVPLIKAPQKIAMFKLFYNDMHTFIEDVKFCVSRRIDMINAFLKPCTKKCLSTMIGEEALFSSSVEFQSAIESGEADGRLVFFLEHGYYIMSEGSSNDRAAKKHLTQKSWRVSVHTSTLIRAIHQTWQLRRNHQ